MQKRINAREREDLELLLGVLEKKRAEFEVDGSEPAGQAWEGARDRAEKFVDRLYEKYFVEDPAFDSLAAVLRSLKEQGYKVQKSKLYQDRKAGLIKVRPDHSVVESEVLAYIQRAGLQKKWDHSGEMDETFSDKTRKEVTRLELQIERERFDLDKKRGKYLLKTDVETALAIRVGVFEAGLKHLFQTRFRECIQLAGGNPKKTQMAIEYWNNGIDELLDELARMEEIEVVAYGGA